MSRIFIFMFALILVTLSHQARAQECVISAGEPPEVRVSDNVDCRFPDIYQRQFKYRETLLLLQEDLRERQQAFVAPHLAVKKKYDEDLKELHKSIK